MFKFLLLGSVLLIANSPNPNFAKLKNKLEDYGFQVNIAMPPSLDLPKQQSDFLRRRVRKPYGVLNSSTKSIWINPVVFDLGIDNHVLIHEAVHAAQYCRGNGNLQTLDIDIEPIKQAQPFFKRYINIHAQNLEKEAYTVQTQANSFELATSLLDKYC